MSACPRCDRPIPNTAIRCPHCNLTLTAHGHAGMPLHRATDDTPLCATCTYDADDSCTFPNRPAAMTCTLYQSVQALPEPTRQEIYQMPRRRKYVIWVAIAILIILSLIIASL